MAPVIFVLADCDNELFACCLSVASLTFELPHDKTNKMACARSEDSDQPGHLLQLVFAVRLKKHWALSYL